LGVAGLSAPPIGGIDAPSRGASIAVITSAPTALGGAAA